jgi:V/A-type H+-transporting ATPase subunit D
MILKVNPNRIELMRLQKKLVLARRGHKLLKDKQDELVRKLLGYIKNYRTLRVEVEKKLAQVYQLCLQSIAQAGKEAISRALVTPPAKLSLSFKKQRVMNLVVPELSLKIEPLPASYGFLETTGDLDLGIKKLLEVLPKLINLAQVEKTITLLASEIERTRRRVNALEYILIPNILDTIKYISFRLAEIERGNLVRLMKVKELLGVR